jgi:hypothetical protein
MNWGKKKLIIVYGIMSVIMVPLLVAVALRGDYGVSIIGTIFLLLQFHSDYYEWKDLK